MDRVEDVGALVSLPAVWTGEATVVRGVVPVAVYEVQRSRPPCVETDLIRPGGHRREVAGRVAASHLVNAAVGGEDRADGVEDLRVEVGLGNCSNDFVAFVCGIALAWEGKMCWGQNGAKRTCCAPGYRTREATQAEYSSDYE